MNKLAVLAAIAAAPFLLASTETQGNLYGRFNDGVYLAPSQFEAGFLSTVHTDTDVEATLAAARKAFAQTAKRGA